MIEITEDIDLNLKEIYGISQKSKEERFFEDIWKEKYPILENKDVIIWLSKKINKFKKNGKETNKFSITTYLAPLQHYCNFNEVKNPSDLLKEEVDKRTKRVMEYLDFLLKVKQGDPKLEKIGFRVMKKGDKAGEIKIPNKVSVINMIQSRIKSFYSARGKNIADGITSEKRGLNKQELRVKKETIKLIDGKLESDRYRLAVKLQTQLGLRIGDILEELPKDKYEFEFFDHPEAPRYYIKDFQTIKKGIVINYLFFTEELVDKIKSVYNVKDLTKFKLSRLLKTKSGKPMNSNDYLLRLKKVVKDLGIQKNMKTHAFRKYFSSQIRKSEIDLEFREHLLAHTAVNLSEAYNNDLKDDAWFHTEWLKIEELICVDYTIRNITNKEVVKLKTEIAKLKKQREITIEENAELSLRLDKFEEITKRFEKFIKEETTKKLINK